MVIIQRGLDWNYVSNILVWMSLGRFDRTFLRNFCPFWLRIFNQKVYTWISSYILHETSSNVDTCLLSNEESHIVILFQWSGWTSYFFFNISWNKCNCNSSYIWSWISLTFCEIAYAHNNIWILYRVIDLFEYIIIILRVIHFT